MQSIAMYRVAGETFSSRVGILPKFTSQTLPPFWLQDKLDLQCMAWKLGIGRARLSAAGRFTPHGSRHDSTPRQITRRWSASTMQCDAFTMHQRLSNVKYLEPNGDLPWHFLLGRILCKKQKAQEQVSAIIEWEYHPSQHSQHMCTAIAFVPFTAGKHCNPFPNFSGSSPILHWGLDVNMYSKYSKHGYWPRSGDVKHVDVNSRVVSTIARNIPYTTYLVSTIRNRGLYRQQNRKRMVCDKLWRFARKWNANSPWEYIFTHIWNQCGKFLGPHLRNMSWEKRPYPHVLHMYMKIPCSISLRKGSQETNERHANRFAFFNLQYGNPTKEIKPHVHGAENVAAKLE